jgi:hypothetical protein
MSIFSRSSCSIVKYPASTLLLRLGEMLLYNFIEFQLGVMDKELENQYEIFK